MSTPAVTPQQSLASMVRAKYPGAYDDMDDATLEKSVLAKYPQYADLAGHTQAPGTDTPDALNALFASKGLRPLTKPGYVPQRLEGPETAIDRIAASADQQSAPGSFEGHPENLAGYISSGPIEFGRGLIDLNSYNITRGLHRMISGAAMTALPAAPLSVGTAPVASAAAGGLGLLGQYLAQKAAGAFGASPDQTALLGDIGGLAGGYGAVRGIGALTAKAPIAADEAAAQLTDAINPSPRSMARVQQNIADHLPEIADAANGTQIADRAALSRVLKAVADQKRAAYYQNILEPVGDKTVSVAGSNYNGAMQDPTSRVATLRQLDARLSQINATMRPQYEKGGATAQAAISAEGMQSLKTEAASIRAKLYKEIANATGMAPEDVAKARETFGALGDLADKTQLSISKDRFAQNAAKQGRSVIIDGVPTKAGIADRAFNAAQRAIVGNPADNAIADVFKRLKLTPPPPMGTP